MLEWKAYKIERWIASGKSLRMRARHAELEGKIDYAAKQSAKEQLMRKLGALES